MKSFFLQILRDKNGNFSLREFTVCILLLVLLASWIAQQFFGREIPEFMFFGFASMVAAGVFGYSMERRV